MTVGLGAVIENAGSITSMSGYCIEAGDGCTLINTGTIIGVYGAWFINGANITNQGIISAEGTYAALSVGLGAFIENGVTGLITGNYGIYCDSGALIHNAGMISAKSNGVSFEDNGTLRNDGTVFAGNVGVTSSGTLDLSNSGTLECGGIGAYAMGAGTVANSGAILSDSIAVQMAGGTLDNGGTISGGTTAIYAPGALTLTNTGTISGVAAGIDLNTGAGSLVNAGGISASGTVGYAITTAGSLTLSNTGAISAWQGLSVDGTLYLDNTGSILSTGDEAIAIYAGGGESKITNAGEITGQSIGILTNGTGVDVVTSGEVVSTVGVAIRMNGTGDSAAEYRPDFRRCLGRGDVRRGRQRGQLWPDRGRRHARGWQ